MRLNDWFCITDGRVTEGSENSFECYGDRAYTLSYWNGEHGDNEVSSFVVYDRTTFEVYEVEAFDGAREITYVWRPHEYRAAYDAELKRKSPDYSCEWEEILLETEEDFVHKATAILNGEDYDNRVSVPVDLDDETLYKFMLEAHRRDITFNQLIEEALQLAITKEQAKSTWPFDVNEEPEDSEEPAPAAPAMEHIPEFLKKQIAKERTTWTNGETEGFIGLWNTLKQFPVTDSDLGQFTGGVTSYTYDTPIYIYTAVWYNGDTNMVPDEIIREKKTV